MYHILMHLLDNNGFKFELKEDMTLLLLLEVSRSPFKRCSFASWKEEISMDLFLIIYPIMENTEKQFCKDFFSRQKDFLIGG